MRKLTIREIKYFQKANARIGLEWFYSGCRKGIRWSRCRTSWDVAHWQATTVSLHQGHSGGKNLYRLIPEWCKAPSRGCQTSHAFSASLFSCSITRQYHRSVTCTTRDKVSPTQHKSHIYIKNSNVKPLNIGLFKILTYSKEKLYWS